MPAVCRLPILAALIAVLCATPLSISCGKKADPTLRSFEEPPPVTVLTALHREGEIMLTWEYPPGGRAALKGFSVERAEGTGPDPAFRVITLLGPDASHLTERDFTSGRFYRYRIRPLSTRGVPGNYSPVIDVVPQDPPPAPGFLRAAVGNDFVEISWEPLAGDVLYSIFRRFGDAPYPAVPRNPTPLAEPRYRDTVETERPVFYTVRAYRRTPMRDEGPASEELHVSSSLFVPAVPTGLTAVRGDGVVFLLWAENREQWVRGYRIYRHELSSQAPLLAGFSLTPAFRDRDPLGVTARYCVSAVGPVQESPGRECATVIPDGER